MVDFKDFSQLLALTICYIKVQLLIDAALLQFLI